MKRFSLVILWITLAQLTLYSQPKTVKTSVYFDSDKFVLREDGKNSIDDILDTLLQYNIVKITITGNTDNSADSLYNLQLSENRTNAVKRYILGYGIDEKLIKSNYFGEDKPIAPNDNDQGMQMNRRVDIVFIYKKKSSKKQIVTDTLSKIEEKAVLNDGDTIINLPHGTQLVFNRNEYIEIKDCLEFTEANDPNSVLLNGMSLMNDSGIPIASCGMLKVMMKPGCTERICFKFPVKVRFPVPKENECDYCRRNARVWDINSRGTWVTEQGRKSRVKTIRVNGVAYYEFFIYCPNSWKNCDCLIKGKKVKFKTKKNYKIVNLTITNDCPTLVINTHSKKREHVATAIIPCWQGYKTISDKIINDKGDTLILQQQPLNDLTKRTLFSRCHRYKGQYIGYRLWIFPIYKRDVYRKYIIKPKDLQF